MVKKNLINDVLNHQSMKFLLLLLTIIFSFSCQEKAEDKFAAIKEFKTNKSQYRIETIELENLSTEGGELKFYFNKDKEEYVLDFSVYGETGKLNYIFFTGKNFKYKTIIKKDYQYNQPITEANTKIDSIIYYINFEPTKKLFDQNLNEVADSKKLNTIVSEVDTFFKRTLRENVVIRK